MDLVRRMYEAFYRGGVDAGLAYLDPEVVMDATHRVDGAIGHGREEAAAILAEWLDTWHQWREEVEEIRDLGSEVMVLSTQRGRGKESGIEWNNRFAMVYEIQGGKITRWTIYDDPRKALEAAGLSE